VAAFSGFKESHEPPPLVDAHGIVVIGHGIGGKHISAKMVRHAESQLLE
jgi:hypothetical protein